MDKVVATILVLFLAFLVQYLWQIYRVPQLEALLEDIEAPEALKEHTKEFEEATVVKVTDGVYVAVNYAIANSILLEGPTGVVIVDTTESLEAARQIAEEFRKITTKPVKAVIYTHHHPDHISGTTAFFSESEEVPQIWAHHLCNREWNRIQLKGPVHQKRAVYQFGVALGEYRENAGLGKELKYDMKMDESGFVFPTHWMMADEETLEIAGLNLVLVHIPGETADQIGVWLPDKRVFLTADDLYKTFPNLYAIRGTTPRDVNDWIDSLAKMQRLKPECLVGSHTEPICGRDKVDDILGSYKAGIQFVHDQTVRYMNRGMHQDEIAQKIHFPPVLAEHRYLQEFYGTVPWSSKGIFNCYLGWFSGLAEDLNPLSPSDRSRKMIELVGKRQLLKSAQDALKSGEWQWALELASFVHTVQKDNRRAIDVRKKAMGKLAAMQTSANGRNFYMTAIMADAGLMPPRDVRKQALYIPIERIFQAMRVRLKAEEVTGINKKAEFVYTDTDRTFCLHIHRSVLSVDDASCEEEPDSRLVTTEVTWRQIVAGLVSPVKAYISGDIQIEGGVIAFRRFMDYFEREI